jgi:hypothetical protein
MHTITPLRATGQTPMDTKGATALATRPGKLTVITTNDEYQAYLAAHDDSRFNRLTPQADFGALPPMWSVIPSLVRLNPDPNAGDVYQDRLFCKDGEFAPTKIGLRKIAGAAGISYKITQSESAEIPNYWKMSATITWRGFDADWKDREASYVWDLRDGSERVKGMTPKELSRARLNGHRRCEAGAINAAIREYGLKQKFTKAELEKPFVCFSMVFQGDPNDPAIKAMVAQAALTGTAVLYGSALPALPATSVNVKTGEIIDAFDASKPEPEEKPFVDDPPAPAMEPRGVRVLSVTQQGDDYFVTVDGGRRLHTKDRGIAAASNLARRENATIALEADADGEIIEIGAKEKL